MNPPRLRTRPCVALAVAPSTGPQWLTSSWIHARAPTPSVLELHVAAFFYGVFPLICFVTSTHPHQSITNGTHCRVAQRVPASQSLVDALQLLPHRARPSYTPLHPATLSALSLCLSAPSARGPLSYPLVLAALAPVPSAPFPAHIIHHPSTIPSACLARPCFFSRLVPFCRRWISTWAWALTGLDWTGLV